MVHNLVHNQVSETYKPSVASRRIMNRIRVFEGDKLVWEAFPPEGHLEVGWGE